MGNVGTGVKEKSEGLTFDELTRNLKPLITEQKGKHVKLKPQIVVEIGYDEIQKSPTYSSKYALRFPKIIRKREDLGFNDVDTLDRVKKFYKQQTK